MHDELRDEHGMVTATGTYSDATRNALERQFALARAITDTYGMPCAVTDQHGNRMMMDDDGRFRYADNA